MPFKFTILFALHFLQCERFPPSIPKLGVAKPQKHLLALRYTILRVLHLLQCERFPPSTPKLGCAKPQKHLLSLFMRSTISSVLHCLQCERFPPSAPKLGIFKPHKHVLFLRFAANSELKDRQMLMLIDFINGMGCDGWLFRERGVGFGLFYSAGLRGFESFPAV